MKVRDIVLNWAAKSTARAAYALVRVSSVLSGLGSEMDSRDRKEVVRRVSAYYHEHPGLSEREKTDAAARIMTDYYIEQESAGRRVKM